MTDQPEEDEVPKPNLHPVPAHSAASDDQDERIEDALVKMANNLNGVIEARNAVEQRGVEYHNQATQLLMENEERLLEIDRAIGAEEDLIGKAQITAQHIDGIIQEHSTNLDKLRIERQARLGVVHNLKSADIRS